MAAAESSKAQKQNEKIFGEFQVLRNEQRNLGSKLTTIEMDLKEHKTVIETLKLVNEDRKCFRLIGGVLCERTVKDVLPQLIENKNFLEKTIDVVSEQLIEKGLEINKFKEKHNIKIRGQEPTASGSEQSDSKSSKTEESGQENRNVLVTN